MAKALPVHLTDDLALAGTADLAEATAVGLTEAVAGTVEGTQAEAAAVTVEEDDGLLVSVDAAETAGASGDFPTESFGVDQNPIAGNWTSGPGGFSDAKAASGTFQATVADADCAAIYTGGTFADNQYSQAVTVRSAVGAITDGQGLIVRMDENGNGYLAFLTGGDDGLYNTAQFYKISHPGGVPTFSQLGADITGLSVAHGSTIKLTASGTTTVTLELFDDGASLGTRTDSTSPYQSGAAGLHIYDDTTAGLCKWDNWTGGPQAGVTVGMPCVLSEVASVEVLSESEPYEATDPCAVSLTEAVDLAITVAAGDETAVVGTELAVGEGTGTPADPVGTLLDEDLALLVDVTVDDQNVRTAVGLTEQATVEVVGQVDYTVGDTVGVGLTEQASVDVIAIATDATAVVSTEAVVGDATASAADSAALALTDSPYGQATADVADETAVGLTERADIENILALPYEASDPSQVGTSESVIVSGTADLSESLTAGLDEQAAGEGTGSAADAGTVGVTEGATGAATGIVAESLTLLVSEQAAGEGTSSPADTTTLQAVEAPLVNGVGDVAETDAVGLTEIATVDLVYADVVLTADDAVASVCVEAVLVAGEASATDSAAVQATSEQTTVAIDVLEVTPVEASDPAIIGVTEQSGQTVTVTPDEVGAVGLGEVAEVVIEGQTDHAAADQMAVGVTSAVDLVCTVTPSDTDGLSTSESVTGVGTASAADIDAVQGSEQVGIVGTVSAADDTAIAVGEFAETESFETVLVTATDGVAVVAGTEGAEYLDIVAPVLIYTAEDVAAVGCAEQASVDVTLVGSDSNGIAQGEQPVPLVSASPTDSVQAVSAEDVYGLGDAAVADAAVARIEDDLSLVVSLAAFAEVIGIAQDEAAYLTWLVDAQDDGLVQVDDGVCEVEALVPGHLPVVSPDHARWSRWARDRDPQWRPGVARSTKRWWR